MGYMGPSQGRTGLNGEGLGTKHPGKRRSGGTYPEAAQFCLSHNRRRL